MPKTILLAEDEDAIRDGFASDLREHGFNVVTADNGQDALILGNRQQPDLLILDVGLDHPVYSGIDICRRVKLNRPGTPVIIITGVRQIREHELIADPLGPDYFLRKPVAREDLLAYVRKVLDRTGSVQQELAAASAICCGRLRVHRAHLAWLGDKRLPLRPAEATVLHYLMVRWGNPVSLEDLAVDALARDPTEVDIANIGRLAVTRARATLNAHSPEDRLGDRLIATVRGGYCFVEPVRSCGE